MWWGIYQFTVDASRKAMLQQYAIVFKKLLILAAENKTWYFALREDNISGFLTEHLQIEYLVESLHGVSPPMEAHVSDQCIAQGKSCSA